MAGPVARTRSAGAGEASEEETAGGLGSAVRAVRSMGIWRRQGTAPTTGIAMCHIAVILEQQRESAYGYKRKLRATNDYVRPTPNNGPSSVDLIALRFGILPFFSNDYGRATP